MAGFTLSDLTYEIVAKRVTNYRRHNGLARKMGAWPDKFWRDPTGGNPVTVCTAAIFNWNYGTLEKTDWGFAAIAISDRKMTYGDVEYEPYKQKIAIINNRIAILIAGDLSVHSEALRETIKKLEGVDEPEVKSAALIYGRSIQSIKQRQAEDLYLAPLGLNLDSFTAQQNEFAEHVSTRLLEQMQSYRGAEVEAIVVGHNGLFTVDSNGSATCWDDAGFAAVGIGAWHAKSRLMQAGYTTAFRYIPALTTVFASKKAAEIAPGVSQSSDIHLIYRDGITRLHNGITEQLDSSYLKFASDRDAAFSRIIADMDSAVDKMAADALAAEEKTKRPNSQNSNKADNTEKHSTKAAR